MMSGIEIKERKPTPRMEYPLSLVSFASPGDDEALRMFLHQMRDELGVVDDEVLDEVVRDLTQHSGGAALIVRGDDGDDRIKASLGLKMAQMTLSRKHVLSMIWFGVLPEFRRSTGHAKSLLLAARELADKLGRPLIKEWIDPNQSNIPQAKLIARHIPMAGSLYIYTPAEATAA